MTFFMIITGFVSVADNLEAYVCIMVEGKIFRGLLYAIPPFDWLNGSTLWQCNFIIPVWIVHYSETILYILYIHQ